jgi:Rieske Fe-S protein
MENMNRRQFLKKGTITVAITSTCLCSLNSCATITKNGRTPAIDADSLTFSDNILTIDLSKEPNLDIVGGAVKIKHDDIPNGIIIARVDENRFAIASLLCPHRGVEVEYDHSQNQFKCASLGSSKFTQEGKYISGPAKEPLKEYEATLEDNVLTIKI